MKRIIRLCRVIAMLMVVMIFVPGLSAQAEKMTIIFGDAGWDSMKFHNAVAMLVAERVYGYETDEISGSTAITYNALKTGDIHVYMETWTDSIAPYEEDVKKGAIEELGVNYEDNMQGLYVPRYVIEGDAERGIEPMAPDLKTVQDLKQYSAVFPDPEEPGKGRIFGAISGWQVDEIMRQKIEHYGLDEHYNYIDPGSDPALAAAIAGAYERGEAIVAYYWEPAWITGKYDLVLLEDAPYDPELYLKGQCACPSIRLTVAATPGFSDAHLQLAAFLSKYRTSSQLTSEALAYISDEGASYRDAALWFLKENDQLIDAWLPEADAAKLREAL